MAADPIVLQARRGRALRLKAGARVQIVNVHGQQVVDTWALHADDPSEAMSMEHTRSCLDKLTPSAGDYLFTNLRRPILQLEADTSPGTHDTLLSACDEERYRLLGCKGKHGSCCENFYSALAELGIGYPRVPSPWNLFEHVAIAPNGSLSIKPPVSRPGDSVTLCAMLDAIVIFSACPMDVALTNGLDRTPKDVHLIVR
ncbi:DUF1989 domain-containing protein [Trinickia mobilis]|uniref:DUF1989 domain-containing protein n=1 Tax=Trinickia mobilis TaxID=2816356 RepID=UPI001A8F488D|nr:urea carboxylase-associated family protein [Trinickia mobilis]